MRFWLAVSAVLILAVALRISRLDIRPMHGDEAVHAYRFGQLLEANDYRYDPTEFHGPTLNYFTLIPALLSGQHTYASLTEITLRIVPVFFGLVLVLMPLLLLDGLGRPVAVVACCAYRHIARVCFLQPILYPGNAACVLYFRDDCLRVQIRSQPKWIWALRTGVFSCVVLRHKRDERNCLWGDYRCFGDCAACPQRRQPTLNLVRPAIWFWR